MLHAIPRELRPHGTTGTKFASGIVTGKRRRRDGLPVKLLLDQVVSFCGHPHYCAKQSADGVQLIGLTCMPGSAYLVAGETAITVDPDQELPVISCIVPFRNRRDIDQCVWVNGEETFVPFAEASLTNMKQYADGYNAGFKVGFDKGVRLRSEAATLFSLSES